MTPVLFLPALSTDYRHLHPVIYRWYGLLWPTRRFESEFFLYLDKNNFFSISFLKHLIRVIRKKGSLVESLREVRPTTFFGVPRVWEKIYEKMQALGKQTRGIKRTISKW